MTRTVPAPSLRAPLRLAALAAALGTSAAPSPAGAQALADYDYENLTLRGIGFAGGFIAPSSVESTGIVAVSLDLGYLGPGLRIVPHVTYWDSELDRDEVAGIADSFERAMLRSLQRQLPPDVLEEVTPLEVDLGEIGWSSLGFGADAHFVWRLPARVLTFAGLGAGAHVMNAEGGLLAGTFVEDLLDRVSAAGNAHAGLEYLAGDRLRLFATGRFTFMEDVHYGEIRGGLRLMLRDPTPGEVGR